MNKLNTYVGVEEEGGFFAMALNGKTFDPEPSLQLRKHSPDGFAWGYNGSGPSQLALAILLLETDQDTALAHYMAFREDVVAKLPPRGFALNSAFVQRWLETKGLPTRQLPIPAAEDVQEIVKGAVLNLIHQLPVKTPVTSFCWAVIGPTRDDQLEVLKLDGASLQVGPMVELQCIRLAAEMLARGASVLHICQSVHSVRRDQLEEALAGKIPADSKYQVALVTITANKVIYLGAPIEKDGDRLKVGAWKTEDRAEWRVADVIQEALRTAIATKGVN